MPQTTSPHMLQYLDSLLKHGNFTKASKDLYISQPYLTQLIKKVETDLGVAIVNRKTAHLQLTEAGKRYYRYLETLEKEADQLNKELARFKHSNSTTLRIGVLSSLGTYLLPKLLPLFQRQHPEIKLVIEEALPLENERKLLANEIDFYLGQNPETILPTITAHPCGSDHYFAIIPATSPLYEATKTTLTAGTIPLKELLSAPLVLTTSGSAVRRQVDQLLQKYKVTPTIISESENIYTVASLAKNGLALTIVPESVTQFDPVGAFNLYPISEEHISLQFFIAHAATKTLNPLEDAFIAFFCETLKN